SEQLYKIWELDKEEYTPTVDSFFEFVVPADRNKFHLYANRPIDNIKEQNIQYRIITSTGKLKWIHQYGQRVDDKKNKHTVFKGTIRDITEQKNQEEAILEYNEKLQTAQKIAKLGYWEFDFKNDELIWSDQVFEIWEKSKNSFTVTAEAFYNTIHPDDFEAFMREQKKALQGEKALEKEHRIVLDNEKVKWVLERGELVYDDEGEPLIFEGTVQDITSQKLIELELREQNYFIKTAIDNLPVGIAVRNIDTGKFTLMNKNFTEIYGWSKNEFRDVDSFFDKVYPDSDYRKKIKNQIFSDLASKDLKRMQWEGLHVTTKTGDKRIINARNIPLYDQNLMISTVLDVTEKALAEQRLAVSNERYEYVTKATFDAIWDWDFTSNNMFWGEGFKSIFGHKVENTNPDFWYSNIHPDDFERVKGSLEAAIKNNERNWENEYRFKHANGTYRFVKDRGIILRNVERKALRMIGALQDITSQKEYEMKLLDVNQKLRNLSAHLQEAREEERISIAREIHDELGQQLTGIKLDVSWLKNKVDTKFPNDSERTVRLIENINKTINDVRKIASHLRPGVLDDLGLEAAIEWQTHQFQTQTGIKCTLHFENVSGNFGKEINTAMYRIYQEALTNVMRHAKATEVETVFKEKDDILTLEVTDNGIGIGEADKNNTFSLGITGMRERALMIKADFFVKKQKEGGTKVKVSVNLNS
ncbi:MAG: PAS domain-containing protein, partial [Flavobacteriaceae bacterium]